MSRKLSLISRAEEPVRRESCARGSIKPGTMCHLRRDIKTSTEADEGICIIAKPQMIRIMIRNHEDIAGGVAVEQTSAPKAR